MDKKISNNMTRKIFFGKLNIEEASFELLDRNVKRHAQTHTQIRICPPLVLRKYKEHNNLKKSNIQRKL